jgi:hypothetical protein
MACAQYRFYLGDQNASSQQIATFETITVHQEVDNGWTATVEIPLCTDSHGNWTGETESYLQPLNRVRVEVSLQGGPYVPLIDGPIVAVNHDLHMEPGQSMATVEVQDDGFLLHRDETVKLYPGMTDGDIAQRIFNDNSDITVSNQVDPVPSTNNLSSVTTVLRGTPMELLQQLARRQYDTWHAFILPGPQAHSSIGCFKLDDPTVDSGLPQMILTGNKRNLLNIKFTSNNSIPANFRSGGVSLNDGSVNNSTASLSNVDRMGTNPTGGTAVNRMLRPGQTRNVNLQDAVQAATDQAAFSLTAEGEVLKDTYSAVLQPYQNVQVLGVNGQLSGLWQIRQVTHTLTRNSYGQTFSLRRNGQSAGSGSSSTTPPVPVF